jgi:hypothetical protein
VKRTCPGCGNQLEPLAVRCDCGFEMPEASGVRCADPGSPVCGLCSKEIQLMDQRCPHCGAEGYPAMRPRRGKTSKGAPE